jgi:hypothetical protein
MIKSMDNPRYVMQMQKYKHSNRFAYLSQKAVRLAVKVYSA